MAQKNYQLRSKLTSGTEKLLVAKISNLLRRTFTFWTENVPVTRQFSQEQRKFICGAENYQSQTKPVAQKIYLSRSFVICGVENLPVGQIMCLWPRQFISGTGNLPVAQNSNQSHRKITSGTEKLLAAQIINLRRRKFTCRTENVPVARQFTRSAKIYLWLKKLTTGAKHLPEAQKIYQLHRNLCQNRVLVFG